MPLREIRRKFTKSEIVIIAWRSQEQAFNLKKKFKNIEGGEGNSVEGIKKTASGKKRKVYEGIGPNQMPDEYFDEHGDFNLSKVKGEQARQYMAKLGLPCLPIMDTRPARPSRG